MTKLAYYSDFVVVSLLALACVFMASRASDFTLVWPGMFAAGVVAWLVAEYLFHRYMLHGWFKPQHWIHHIRPKSMAASNAELGKQAFAVFLAWLFFASVGVAARSNSIFSLGQMFAAGFFSGYVSYRFHHHVLHHWTDERLQASAWFKPLHDAHELHHKGGPINFGVQTLLVDRLAGTFKK
jgi:hypothetical protein